ncbi:tyrosine-type recombinase/integrase [Actinoplanes sp. LDG1-06]|uniref:Tyrosine-type recombinase/integrase n=2 Tax=Paractinoplanes ovalisporus TaxID=2810368 RepID=A0ABS2AAK5_9ACTN|nr:tyrosine-type recombinase/integrase [Actinoplanes ovalisporus]
MFEREDDAKNFDAACRTGIAPEVRLEHSERNVTFPSYADRWREARVITWGIETRGRIESNIRLHLKLAFPGIFRAVTQTEVLMWLTRSLADGVAPSSVRLYFELFDAICAAAVVDGALPANPCDGIKLSQVFRGLTRTPKWVPSDQDVIRLFEVVPERYHLVLLLGAGEALRIGEALGVEDGPRCFEPEHGELHVVQQLGYEPSEYEGGHHLRLPKGVRTFDPASSTVDLDPMVARGLAWHRQQFPPVEVEMLDLTAGRPVRRRVPLLVTTTHGNPFTDRTWSGEWVKWRRLAGWPEDPKHSGFHALRHYFATKLIAERVDPKDVQRALRHATLQLTLEVYVHFWPRAERRRGIVGEALKPIIGGRW